MLPFQTMLRAKKDAFIFLGLLILTFGIWLLTLGQSAIDIQLHDTYFVLDKLSMTILIIGPLTFLVFLARGLTRKFRSISTNTGLIIGLILVALITYRIIDLEKSYLSYIKGLDVEGSPDRGQLIAAMKGKINWTWCIFGLWTTGIILLTMQTIRIRKEGATSNNS